jgi:tetratricopeptide (TPR) repeat protein
MTSDRAAPCNSHAWMLALEDKPSDSAQKVALELSEVAINLSPQSSYLWNTRALVLARAERWQECLEAIDKAISLTKEGTPSDWFIKSMALAGSGDFDNAKHWFAKAESTRTSKSPNHSDLRKQSQLAQTILLRNKPE